MCVRVTVCSSSYANEPVCNTYSLTHNVYIIHNTQRHTACELHTVYGQYTIMNYTFVCSGVHILMYTESDRLLMLQAIVNPLQGLFNAIAYGGVCTSFWVWFRAKLKSREIPYVSSWSGEYINVDFRVSRGKIHHSKRRPLAIKRE